MGHLFYDASAVKEPPISEALSSREIEVLRLIADGLTSKEVAVQLGISFKTAASHRYHIMQKLYVTSTIAAVRCAIRQGIVAP